MKTTCNNCLDEFEIEPSSIQMVTIKDLDIQFFPCPSCGWKFVIFAADAEMKKMVAERGEIQKQIRVARIGNLRQKTVRRLVARQNKLINAQKKLWSELKPRVERLLREGSHGKV